MNKLLKYIIIVIAIIIILIFSINLYMYIITKPKIKNIEEITDQDIDCILILGAGIRGEKPSPMLEDRLLVSIDAYNKNLSNKIIVSGDHGRIDYDEVNIMKKYLIDNNIKSENIFMDHAGFSTYDSIYRAKEIFQAKKVVIITQEYHLPRALYIARELGLESYGISASKREYHFQIKRDIREYVARVKDFIKSIFKPQPKYLGDIIPVSGNGNITNDK